MEKLINTGKYLFAIAIGAFGLLEIVTGSTPGEFMPLPKEMPGSSLLAYITGIIFIVAGALILLGKMAKTAATSVGLLFIILLLYPRLPSLLSEIRNPNQWVAFLETLSCGCGAFILADKELADARFMLSWNRLIHKTAIVGCYLFAVALFIFGVQHIMYEKFIVKLMPDWIPGKLYWSHLVKIAFITTAISIILNFKTRLVATLAGLMFLSWVLIHHAPRVAADTTKEAEWTSLFVAMAMSGICFLIAGRKRIKFRY
ncbi:MAG TPA: hypothetical protein VGD17_06800 [Chitinophagaceae bacterium]